jgi:alanine or glycine:cation symporter, AGCS family
MNEWIQHLAQVVAGAVTAFLGPLADFLEGYVWNWPPQAPLLAVVLLGAGLFVTVRLGFIQVRGFLHAVAIARGKYDDPNDAGDLKHYQALTTALSATVGIGNIAGVAIAIRMGGPGALFWMWLTAFFGMALKFAECTLALRYRKVHADGSVSGGPMYYIEKGLGARWKPMAIAFASFTVICSFGSGNMNQSNTMADAMASEFGIHPVWTALVASVIVGLVVIGGIRRIGRVTGILAPAMALLYVGGALTVLMLNVAELPSAVGLIFREAFQPSSIHGGATGSMLLTLMWGIRRGLFSNEAGQGSAPIAHAAAKTKEPVREGLVASLGPFIDTLVICSMTGLVIVVSGAWTDNVQSLLPLDQVAVVESQSGQATVAGGKLDHELIYLGSPVAEARIVDGEGAAWSGSLGIAPGGGLEAAAGEQLMITGGAVLTGAPLTAYGFSKVLPGKSGNLIVTFAVLLFAISTAISWSYYGDRATEYLFGARWIGTYRWVYLIFFFLGAILPLQAVWTFGDVALGLMSFPNLLALILLSRSTVAMTREYFSREHRPFQ